MWHGTVAGKRVLSPRWSKSPVGKTLRHSSWSSTRGPRHHVPCNHHHLLSIAHRPTTTGNSPLSLVQLASRKQSTLIKQKRAVAVPRPRSRRIGSRKPHHRLQSSTTSEAASEVNVTEPSFDVLKIVALTQAIPFVGFGFMDNAILIIAGDAIDTSLGVILGISTMCAAAIGNIISDLAGIMLGTVIEDFSARWLNLPATNLTQAQRKLRSVRFASQGGMAIGMTVGCILGMFPLLFIDNKKVEHLKKQARLESLFQDVVTEAKSLIGAESTCLYLRVEDDNSNNGKQGSSSIPKLGPRMPYRPSVDGDHLYAMYYDVPRTTAVAREALAQGTAPASSSSPAARCLPLGKGIVSRAIMTGEAWNISNVHDEPDFFPEMEIAVSPNDIVGDDFKDMVVVPVLDGQGRAIAVIRAMNKLPDRTPDGQKQVRFSPGGFTIQDVQVLKSLASHISVNLQSVFQDEDDEELRLRDTIRILKEHRRRAESQKSRRQQKKQQRSVDDTAPVDEEEDDEPTYPRSMRARSLTTAGGSSTSSRESLFPE